jgi:predicted ArsR family transcriptional regulator
MDTEVLQIVADFYGGFTVDELAERLGVPTVEMIDYLEDLVDENFDALAEEMEYEENDAGDED